MRHFANVIFLTVTTVHMSCGAAVGIATNYGLDNLGLGVRIPVGSRIINSPYHPDRL
jgi:hypothetical protein